MAKKNNGKGNSSPDSKIEVASIKTVKDFKDLRKGVIQLWRELGSRGGHIQDMINELGELEAALEEEHEQGEIKPPLKLFDIKRALSLAFEMRDLLDKRPDGFEDNLIELKRRFQESIEEIGKYHVKKDAMMERKITASDVKKWSDTERDSWNRFKDSKIKLIEEKKVEPIMPVKSAIPAPTPVPEPARTEAKPATADVKLPQAVMKEVEPLDEKMRTEQIKADNLDIAKIGLSDILNEKRPGNPEMLNYYLAKLESACYALYGFSVSQKWPKEERELYERAVALRNELKSVAKAEVEAPAAEPAPAPVEAPPAAAEPAVESKAKFKTGDLVQWTFKGVYQFKKGRKIVKDLGIGSDGKRYYSLEKEEEEVGTGVPEEQLSLFEAKTSEPVPAPMIEPPPAPMPLAIAEPSSPAPSARDFIPPGLFDDREFLREPPAAESAPEPTPTTSTAVEPAATEQAAPPTPESVPAPAAAAVARVEAHPAPAAETKVKLLDWQKCGEYKFYPGQTVFLKNGKRGLVTGVEKPGKTDVLVVRMDDGGEETIFADEIKNKLEPTLAMKQAQEAGGRADVYRDEIKRLAKELQKYERYIGLISKKGYDGFLEEVGLKGNVYDFLNVWGQYQDALKEFFEAQVSEYKDFASFVANEAQISELRGEVLNELRRSQEMMVALEEKKKRQAEERARVEAERAARRAAVVPAVPAQAERPVATESRPAATVGASATVGRGETASAGASHVAGGGGGGGGGAGEATVKTGPAIETVRPVETARVAPVPGPKIKIHAIDEEPHAPAEAQPKETSDKKGVLSKFRKSRLGKWMLRLGLVGTLTTGAALGGREVLPSGEEKERIEEPVAKKERSVIAELKAVLTDLEALKTNKAAAEMKDKVATSLEELLREIQEKEIIGPDKINQLINDWGEKLSDEQHLLFSKPNVLAGEAMVSVEGHAIKITMKGKDYYFRLPDIFFSIEDGRLYLTEKGVKRQVEVREENGMPSFKNAN